MLNIEFWVDDIFFFRHFIIIIIILNKFIYFWLRWVFIAAHGLSLVVASGGYSSLRCVGFSFGGLLQSTGSRGTQASVVVARGLSGCGLQALERRLSSCGAQA